MSSTLPLSGLCECGCGQRTALAHQNGRGYRKGEPIRFVSGHNTRVAPPSPPPRGEGHDYIVDPDTGCWIWQHYINERGYGRLKRSGKHGPAELAHRWYYRQLVGPIPDGMHLDHVWERGCRHTACVNPAHLEPVTHLENVRRWRVLQTHCKYGHPFEGDNLYVDKGGVRQCRACNKRRQDEFRARRKAATGKTR